jgi:ADP-ribose pyrophosphatase YjhB (NUDIX family)
MPITRDAHCHACGAAFADTSRYPRTCGSCGLQVWANPIPVSVVLVPVRVAERVGLLVVRRAIEPKKGRLGIVGGFLEEHETWQQGGAREVFEETGARIDPSAVTPFWFTSTEPRPHRVLLFSVAKELDGEAIEPFAPNAECSERGLVFGPGGLEEVLAFPLHAEAARRYFASRGIDGPHGYVTLP